MIERIKSLLSVKNLSASGLAAEIGVQRSSVSHILSGRNKPSLDFVLKLKERFSDLNLDWLLYGKGEMFVRDIKILNKPSSAITAVKESLYDKDKTGNLLFDERKNEKPNLFSEERKQLKAKEEIESDVINEPDMARSENMPYYSGVDSKKVKKIVLFYEDNTFEEFKPKK